MTVPPPEGLRVASAEGHVCAVVDAADGARITSLRIDDTEWLVPPPRRRTTPGASSATDSFVAAGTGGWDDCLPTVEACRLLDGTPLPDHGEAWRRPWEVTRATADRITTRLSLDTAPLTITRTVAASAAGILIDWAVSTDSLTPVPVLWSAHPLFAAPPGTRIDIAATTAVCEYPSQGGEIATPTAIDDIGSGRAVKAFVTGVDRAVVRRADGRALRVHWAADPLRHVGLYLDRDLFTETPCIAIEPTTGASDSAARAEDLPTTVSGAPLTWWMAVCPSLPAAVTGAR